MGTFLAAFAGAVLGTLITHYTGIRPLLNALLAKYGITPK
jgi:hypothetical protein